MTGQAGVWMLMVLFLCLCTSTVRAGFFSSHGGGGGGDFPSAGFDCCSQTLNQGKALLAGQDQLQQILFSNRNALGEVGDDVLAVNNDTAAVLQNQAITLTLIDRYQLQVLPNISIVQDNQAALRENVASFQALVTDGISKLQAAQTQTLQDLADARAAVKAVVRNEHEASRALVTQTGDSIQTTLAELKGSLDKAHASIAALTELVQACCNRRPDRRVPGPRPPRVRDPYVLY